MGRLETALMAVVWHTILERSNATSYVEIQEYKEATISALSDVAVL